MIPLLLCCRSRRARYCGTIRRIKCGSFDCGHGSTFIHMANGKVNTKTIVTGTLVLHARVLGRCCSHPQSRFRRWKWDRDGVLSNGDDFFGGTEAQTLAQLQRRLDTASMVARWREANPGLAGTEADCVRESIRGVAEAMGKRGVPLQEVSIRTGSAVVLLLSKRD